MSVQFNAEIENALQSLLETYSLAQEYGDEETRDPNTYLKLVAELLISKENAKRTDDALAVAKEQRTVEDFKKEYEQVLETRLSKKFDSKKCAEYKQFKEQISRAHCEEPGSSNTTRVEADDFVMEGEISIFDPLTKQRMQNPVRNTLCNHHYERSSILEAIHINKRLKCPVAGCGNKQFVMQQHLIDDNIFKTRLQKIAEQEDMEE